MQSERQFIGAGTVLLFIVLASVVLRWALVLNGGQFFFPDEDRYLSSRLAAGQISAGNVKAALVTLTTGVDHLGFKFVGVIPALVEVAVGPNPAIPAMFFSLFSVLAIVLVWCLALRAGAGRAEAVWAAFLLSASNAFFYYAPHIVPYDVAMALGLAALCVGLSKRTNPWASVFTGLLSFATFVTYNGYWVMAGAAMLTHIWWHRGGVGALTRAACAGVGFTAPLLLMYLAGQWLYGKDLLASYSGFAATVTQGDYAEGAALPFLYLWSTESFLLPIMGILLIAAVLMLRPWPQRLRAWTGGLLLVFACLAIASTVMEIFVVYGRLVRQMVPFMVLAAASGMRAIELRVDAGRTMTLAVGLVLVAVAAGNFREPFLLIFPRDFVATLRVSLPDFDVPEALLRYDAPDVYEVGAYEIRYVKFIHPFPRTLEAARGRVVASAPHPHAYLPFQYEGYGPFERAVFAAVNFDMRVSRITPH